MALHNSHANQFQAYSEKKPSSCSLRCLRPLHGTTDKDFSIQKHGATGNRQQKQVHTLTGGGNPQLLECMGTLSGRTKKKGGYRLILAKDVGSSYHTAPEECLTMKNNFFSPKTFLRCEATLQQENGAYVGHEAMASMRKPLQDWIPRNQRERGWKT